MASKIQEAPKEPDGFYQWTRADINALNDSILECDSVHKSYAYNYDYSNLAPGISGRPGLTHSDYSKFRPNEAVPRIGEYKKIFAACDYAYNTFGLIRNVVDMMSDFASQDIRIVHPNKKTQTFYRHWFNRVEGQNVSERFMNYLLRFANNIIKIQTGRVTKRGKEEIYKSAASEFRTIIPLDRNEIPTKYTFLNPSMVEIVGGPLASFVGNPTLALTLPLKLKTMISSPQTQQEREIVRKLPEDIKAAARSGAIPLNPDRTLIYHYKKDDWNPWAYPMIYPILKDILMLEKLQLADLTALDGAISKIRIFRVGNLEHGIAPTPAHLARLSSILEGHVAGGTLDLVWTPAIDIIETASDAYRFLGREKYIPHLDAVHGGLGIPSILSGSGGSAGTTNNFIQLKTMIKRLNGIRAILKGFWDEQFIAVQKAMKFTSPAKLEVDKIDFNDEAAERALWIQMLDRNIISDELFQYKWGHDPEMEKTRINREDKERRSGKKPQKISGLPLLDDQLKKIALQTGISTPSEVGLELNENKKGQVSALKMKERQANKKANNQPGTPQQGRPVNSKDGTKRKKKTFSPKLKASVSVWAKDAQDYIASELNPGFLEHYGKANFRQLSEVQQKEVEKLKLGVLVNMEALSELNYENLQVAFNKSQNMSQADAELRSLYIEQFGKEPTLPQLRELYRYFYVNKVELEYEHD